MLVISVGNVVGTVVIIIVIILDIIVLVFVTTNNVIVINIIIGTIIIIIVVVVLNVGQLDKHEGHGFLKAALILLTGWPDRCWPICFRVA